MKYCSDTCKWLWYDGVGAECIFPDRESNRRLRKSKGARFMTASWCPFTNYNESIREIEEQRFEL